MHEEEGKVGTWCGEGRLMGTVTSGKKPKFLDLGCPALCVLFLGSNVLSASHFLKPSLPRDKSVMMDDTFSGCLQFSESDYSSPTEGRRWKKLKINGASSNSIAC